MLETQYLRDKKAMEVAQQQFRENCQQKEARKEWDLSNPDHLKMDLPARVRVILTIVRVLRRTTDRMCVCVGTDVGR